MSVLLTFIRYLLIGRVSCSCSKQVMLLVNRKPKFRFDVKVMANKKKQKKRKENRKKKKKGKKVRYVGTSSTKHHIYASVRIKTISIKNI